MRETNLETSRVERVRRHLPFAICLLMSLAACTGSDSAEQQDELDAATSSDGQVTDQDADANEAGWWQAQDAGFGSKSDADTVVPWTAPPPPRVEAPSCRGSALACTLRGSSSCSIGSGCRLEGECEGSARSCFNQISTYSCASIAGCYWSSSGKYCAGSSRDCSLFPGSASCTGQPGCSWTQQCAGTALICEGLSAASCSTQPGCLQTCAPGLSLCSSSCVDLSDDEQNCGTCSFACGPRSDCVAGRCECAAPFLRCDGRCVDPGTANDNCGQCGNVCTSGYACTAGRCADTDECAAGSSCLAGRACTNTPGGFSCGICPAGYQASGPYDCADLNECAVANGGCDPKAPCINTVGSFSCGGCVAGFTKEPTTGACVDVDECSVNNGGCDALTSCTNVPGTRTCGSCPSGYTGNGATGCNDANECLTSSSCDPLVSCQNTVGSYSCGSCPPGYSGTGKTGCMDIDECATNTASCPSTSVCQNRPGTYQCVDRDECALQLDDCPANSICTNTAPGFTCHCADGFALAGGECKDVDECALDGLLLCPGAARTCQNTPGGYDCTCPAGMTRAGIHCAPMLVASTWACGLTVDHQMRCQANYAENSQPQAGSFAQLDVGLIDMSCAVRLDGSLHCWGYAPGGFYPPGGSFSSVGVGYSHACALATNGQVSCWNAPSLPQGQSPPGTFQQLSVGRNGNCAVRRDHTVECWGDFAGQSPPAGVAFSRVGAGSWPNACGVATDGSIRCWGSDPSGLLSARPLDTGYIDVKLSGNFACAQRADRTLRCWAAPGKESELVHPDVALVQFDLGSGICGITTSGAARCWSSFSQVPASFP